MSNKFSRQPEADQSNRKLTVSPALFRRGTPGRPEPTGAAARRGRRQSVTSISSHPTNTTGRGSTRRSGLSAEKPQKIGFLYVAPLTPEMDDSEQTDGFVAPCATLDLSAVGADADALGGILEKTKKMIELVVRPLTDRGFRNLGEAGAHILHINVHGNHKGFAAEDGCGGLTPLSVQSFKNIITSGGFVHIEIIIVCSPNQPAQNIGLELHELGISQGAGVGGDTPGRAAFHVVCIETEKLAQDAGARTFLFGLYQSLMKGHPVQYSVEQGKKQVINSPEVSPDQAVRRRCADKIQCLASPGTDKISLHSIPAMGDVEVRRLSFTKVLPPPPLWLSGWNWDIRVVVSAIVAKRRVMLRGPQAVGKTSVAIAAAHYVADWGHFPGGAYMVSIKKAKSPDAMKPIIGEVLEARGLLTRKEERSCLLVLDDIEKVIKADRHKFNDAIRGLQNALPSLHVLLIQEESIRGGLPPGLAGEEVITLRRQAWPFDLLGTPDGLSVPEKYARGVHKQKPLPGPGGIVGQQPKFAGGLLA